ncbi:MAG TPA: prepilin-type N-terminal cleavage/methylation domain-containing protein [Candidatus Omnitrophota bacterium]|nr:prepilin-type N-terminal cleavage/methylation domain-containing protein [Candidatus Omnitrophota bacterium]HPT06522.1 prepilin-type N-terminal cleavage/methylation domain-containing protein [Candidatus Omnitrophota bacterium]
MNPIYKRSFTLVELIMAIILLSIITLGLSSLDVFSRVQVFSADRRTQLQQEGALIMAHIGRHVSGAIGNEFVTGADTVVQTTLNPNFRQINIFVDNAADVNNKGRYDLATDMWTSYRWDLGNGPNAYHLRYCGQCFNQNCNFNQCVTAVEVLGIRVSNFNFIVQKNAGQLTSNAIDFTLTECWDPDGNPIACGDSHNPSFTIQNTAVMPSVSTN